MLDTMQVRQDQQRDGERRTLRVPAGKSRKQFVAKGHDAILKSIQDEGGQLSVFPISSDVQIVGKLIARDKYTITLLTKEGRQMTFYKHAIESFEPVRVQ